MAYRIAGKYTAICDCRNICPCPVDGTPTGPGDQCMGVAVFAIADGNLDGTDLGGTSFALFNHFPANLTAGNWKVGIVIDEGASDDQAGAIERIMSGEEGGPFAEFAPLIADFAGVERGKVSLQNGNGSVEGKSEFTFEAFTGPDGEPTMVHDAMFGFAKDYTIGKSKGTSDAFGLSFTADGNYGEHADFEFSSEATGEVHPRA
jgi:hypothetical protein